MRDGTESNGIPSLGERRTVPNPIEQPQHVRLDYGT